MAKQPEDMTKEELETEIQDWKHHIYCKENSDDFYYTNGGHYRDTSKLAHLRAILKEKTDS